MDIVQVLSPYKAKKKEEISVAEGAQLEILGSPSKGILEVVDKNTGVKGVIPEKVLLLGGAAPIPNRNVPNLPKRRKQRRHSKGGSKASKTSKGPGSKASKTRGSPRSNNSKRSPNRSPGSKLSRNRSPRKNAKQTPRRSPRRTKFQEAKVVVDFIREVKVAPIQRSAAFNIDVCLADQLFTIAKNVIDFRRLHEAASKLQLLNTPFVPPPWADRIILGSECGYQRALIMQVLLEALNSTPEQQYLLACWFRPDLSYPQLPVRKAARTEIRDTLKDLQKANLDGGFVKDVPPALGKVTYDLELDIRVAEGDIVLFLNEPTSRSGWAKVQRTDGAIFEIEDKFLLRLSTDDIDKIREPS